VSRTLGRYDELADEYYDASRHPTSANFRAASDRILESWIPQVLPPRGVVYEVGAGDSALAPLLARRWRSLQRLVITDASAQMLSYSEKWSKLGASLVTTPAEALPVKDDSVSLLVASLGDPFNTSAFWQEVARVLRPSAPVIFTTPSPEWAVSFRRRNADPPDAAEFVLRTTRRLLVPSHVYSEKRQLRLMKESGIAIEAVYHVLIDSIADPISSKILAVLSAGSPFVTGYLGRTTV
jgi:ubiquinone/menaquinone biosynthesis C-methylase UbiE